MKGGRHVAEIAVSPVQGFALLHPQEVVLGPRGIAENRRFCLIDGKGERLRSSATAWTSRVRAEYDAGLERLVIAFPGGDTVEGSAVAEGAEVRFDGRGRIVEGRIVEGPWSEGLARLAGHPVSVVRTTEPGTFREMPVTLLGRASLARLEREIGVPLDSNRFRMLFMLDGCEEHEEDAWTGRRIRIGDTMLRVGGPVPRCAVITRDPATGTADIDPLRVLAGYREAMTDGGVPFGVYATVETTGPVRIGDPVDVL
jgi:uncharacterized protein YcbX